LDAAWQFANEDGSILTGEGHPAVVALRTGQVAQGKVVRISHPGKQGYHWVVINAVPKFEKNVDYPSQVFTIYSDVTTIKQAQDEQEKLQIQLMQANKMESIGRLAGGVAHDFNNMLQTILGNIELALIETTTGSRLRDRLEEVHKAALRSADLTRQLLAFARKQPINPIVLDLNDAVLSIFEMLQRLIGEDIDLVWVPGPDLWHVRVDPSQVDQVLTNLMVNARDAIDGVGKIVVVTSNIVCDEATCALNPGMDPDEYVVLAVSDNGTGMDQETISRLFEPFFTTKEIGRGTGLGLSTVFGIVKQNNGYIKVSSEPGQGTTFNIYLRRVEAEVAPIIVIKTMETAPGGVEMVLVVEDEEALLEMVKETLEDQGYRVLAAGTPAEALRLVQEEQAGEIELLITDVVMPEMNGRVLADKLRTIQPGLKCLFMSGYTADIITDHGVLDEGVYFIQKPFSLNGLASIVRKVLEKK
jgi:signal transduction histidine kinase/CheY-like chemotaxis protein